MFAQGLLTSGVPVLCMRNNVRQIAHFWLSKKTGEKLVKTFTVRTCSHTEKRQRDKTNHVRTHLRIYLFLT